MPEITIIKEKLPQLTSQSARYYFSLDGERVGEKYFLANADRQEYKIRAEEGNHKVAVHQVAFSANAVPTEILTHDIEVSQTDQSLYLRYRKSEKKVYFSQTAAEEGKKSGGLFGWLKG